MKLHEQRDALKARLAVAEAGLESMRRYVNSPKFRVDTQVQVGDILLRLNEVAQELEQHPMD